MVIHHVLHHPVVDTREQLLQHAGVIPRRRESAMTNTGSLVLKSIQALHVTSGSPKVKKVAVLQTGTDKRFVHYRQTNIWYILYVTVSAKNRPCSHLVVIRETPV